MISLYHLLEACNGQLFGEPHSQLFTGLCFDASQPQADHLYVAARSGGEVHAAMQEAVRNGATGLLTVTPPAFNTDGLSVILVRDLYAALLGWTRALLSKCEHRFVVIAGDHYRPVTANAIARILSDIRQDAPPIADLYVLAAALTRPQTSEQTLVLHWSPALAVTLSELGSALTPDVVIIAGEPPNDPMLTQQLEALGPDALVITDHGADQPRTPAAIATVGIDAFGADWLAINLITNVNGTGFDLRHNHQRWVGRWTHLLGVAQVRALLRALAAAHHLGASVDASLNAIKEMEPLPGHLRPLAGPNGATVVDSSAVRALPEALTALDWLAAVRADNRRTTAIVGPIDSPSAPNHAGYRAIGLRATEAASYLLTEGISAANAARAALDSGMHARNIVVTYSVGELIDAFRQRVTLNEDDVVLVIGGQQAGLNSLVARLCETDDEPPNAEQTVGTDLFSLSAQTRPSRVEIDLDALANNVQRLKAMVGPGVVLTAVVKADAYGSGAVSVARTALRNGAGQLAVASLGEALELREAGIDAPILVMSYTAPAAVRHAVRHNIDVTVYDLGLARAYDQMAASTGGKLRVHVKVDTGMGRIGFMPQDTVAAFRYILGLQHLTVDGIYTHFASADEDSDYTAEQARVFMDIVKPLRAAGLAPRYIHACNSAGTLAYPQFHYNMVRVGLAMHGLSPSEFVRVPDGFQPVMRWTTFVAQVKTLPDGHTIGYGQTYACDGEQRVAVLPIGYADGFRRGPANSGEVLIRGQRAPLVGRVSMEKSVALVTHIPDVGIGDEVVIVGQQGQEWITADDVAARWGTIAYEVLCSALARQPRG